MMFTLVFSRWWLSALQHYSDQCLVCGRAGHVSASCPRSKDRP